jgi:hypothetical protein
MNIFSKLTKEEAKNLENLLNDYKVYQTTESEAKREKEKTGKAIKEILDKIGMNETECFSNYTITYKEQIKFVADSDKMKECGIFEAFSKEQKTKPLTVR